MKCPRCEGLMVKDDAHDGSYVMLINRCVNCGHREDISKHPKSTKPYVVHKLKAHY